MSSLQLPKRIEPSDWTLFAVVVALAVFAVIDPNYAFLVTCLGIPCALIWVWRIGFVHRNRPRAARALGLAGAFVLSTVGPVSCTIQTKLLEARLETTIAALESYRSVYGQYPKNLGELHPVPPAECSPPFPRKAHYYATNGNTEFSLTCATFGMNRHTYSSVTRAWKDWD